MDVTTFTPALAGADIVDQLVEGVALAVVGTDHSDFTAPDQQGQRRL